MLLILTLPEFAATKIITESHVPWHPDVNVTTISHFLPSETISAESAKERGPSESPLSSTDVITETLLREYVQPTTLTVQSFQDSAGPESQPLSLIQISPAAIAATCVGSVLALAILFLLLKPNRKRELLHEQRSEFSKPNRHSLQLSFVPNVTGPIYEA
jgi:hypothetical protein